MKWLLLTLVLPSAAHAIGLCEETADDTTFRGFSPRLGQLAIERFIETCTETEEGDEARTKHRFVEIRTLDGTLRLVMTTAAVKPAEREALETLLETRVLGPQTLAGYLKEGGFQTPKPTLKHGVCVARLTLGAPRENDEGGNHRPIALAVDTRDEKGVSRLLGVHPLGDASVEGDGEPDLQTWWFPESETLLARSVLPEYVDQGALGGYVNNIAKVHIIGSPLSDKLGPCFEAPAKKKPATKKPTKEKP